MAFRFAASLDGVRDYWNARPCNIRHSDKEVGTLEYFTEVKNRKYLVEPHILGFADFERWRGKRVLEIGSGLGTDTEMFARHGAIVTAIDYSEESLKLAQKRIKIFELDKQVTFYHADVERLSREIPVEKYDLIYSFGVLHHTPNPGMALSELKKFMGRGSQLKIMVYHRDSLKAMGARLRHPLWPADKAIAMHSEAQTGCPVTYSYSRASVRELLCGFKITDMFVDHIFPYIIPLYKQYEYKKVWYFRMLSQSIFHVLERTLGWHLCVTATLPQEETL